MDLLSRMLAGLYLLLPPATDGNVYV